MVSRPGLGRERLGALFALGLVLFLPPALWIVNVSARIGGIPLLYLYLYLAWGAVIALAAAIVSSRSFDSEAETRPGSGEPPTAER